MGAANDGGQSPANPIVAAIVAIAVLAFSAFVLYVTRTPGGDLSTAGVALVGTPVGVVVAYFFHSQGIGQGAAISASGTAAGIAATTGLTTTVSSPAGSGRTTIERPTA